MWGRKEKKPKGNANALAKANAIGPGTVLATKYKVEGLIGKGGMAMVVMARHVELGQRVAIKLLPEKFHNDTELVTRFMREAQAAVRLRSEHVVKVSDVGKHGTGPFMVMELLSGEDLGRVIARQQGGVGIAFAVDCILQACEAVAEAHGIGIVHRDLKPKNLFIIPRPGGDGRPFIKVLDFGLAKQVSLMEDTGALTATTAVMGSPHYMSPEQMRASKNVDVRTDIWALGVCLYELLTGHAPFPGETVAVVCAQVLKQPPIPLAKYLPTAPAGLAHVVDVCLQKDPIARFPNVIELVRALEPFAPAHAQGAAERIGKMLRALPTMQLGQGSPTGHLPLGNPNAQTVYAAARDGVQSDRRDTHNPATLDSDPGARRSRFFVPLAVALSILVVAASAIGLALKLRSAPTPTPDRVIATPAPSSSPTPSVVVVVEAAVDAAATSSANNVQTAPIKNAPRSSSSTVPNVNKSGVKTDRLKDDPAGRM